MGAIALGKIPLLVLCVPASEVYRSMANPKISVIAQVTFIALLIPGCILSLLHGFATFVWVRAALYLIFALIHAAILHRLIDLRLDRLLASVGYPALATLAMAALALGLKRLGSGMAYDLASIALCAGLYLLLIWKNPSTRELLKLLITKPEKSRNQDRPEGA